MTNKQPKSEDWEKEFEKLFLDLPNCMDRECMYIGESRCFHGIESEVKGFIKKALQQQREEIGHQLASIADELWDEGESTIGNLINDFANKLKIVEGGKGE